MGRKQVNQFYNQPTAMPRSICYLIFFLPAMVWAQLPGSCGAGVVPATSCKEVCIICDFNGYSGSTIGFPSTFTPKFCGTVENVQWLGFISGEPQATFIVTPFNCVGGDGVQVALYDDCQADPIACDKGQMDGGNLPVSISVSLITGRNYFLLIDGYAGDLCDFTVTVDPPSAVFKPALGNIGILAGPDALCPGGTAEFATQSVNGASAYIWDGPPGTLVNGDSVPVVVPAPGGIVVDVTIGNIPGPVCVQAANSCQATPPCGASKQVNLLDDSYRPVLGPDTLGYLGCIDGKGRLKFDIFPPVANYNYVWTEADSSAQILSDSFQAEIVVGTLGRYAFSITNRDNGCSSRDTVRVAGQNYPGDPDLNLQHITCYGYRDGNIGLRGMGRGSGPFKISFNNEPYGYQQEFSWLEAGDYPLKVLGSDGCSWDTVLSLTQPDELILALPADSTIKLGQVVRLYDTTMVNYPSRIKELRIEPEALAPMLCDSCWYTPFNSFRFRLTVLDSNGCKGWDEREVLLDRTRRVYFPNAFMPNGLGENAMFRLFAGDDVANVSVFRVFNRWGNLIYEYLNPDPFDLSWGWDGRYGGKLADPGVYLYQTEVQFIDGERLRYQGEVTVVR